MMVQLTRSSVPKSTGQPAFSKTAGVVFKVFRMITKRFILVILLLAIGCQQAGVNADSSAATADKDGDVLQQVAKQKKPRLVALQNKNKEPARPVSEAELDKQLKINRDALLRGSSDAAAVMLLSEAPAARKILLDTLKQSENNAARVAVCKALSQTRTAQEPENKENFIQPLLTILTTEADPAIAELVAEATLIYEYEQLSEQLGKILADASQPPRARLNAIEALKRPDIGAISKLMELLEDPEAQVVTTAEKTLKSLGIPVGKDAQARKRIIGELRRKGKDEFLRDRLIHQEGEMTRIETERDFWQKQYLVALDRIYDSISDDVEKGKFLAEHLGGSKTVVRLWALEKVYQSLVRTGARSKLPAELGPILVGLISDQHRDVQLKTAKLLSLMVELSSAEKLLKQLKAEKDDEVRMELFVALGGACYYAFSPDSGIKISPEVRNQTLEEAAKYLAEVDRQKAQNGAEVIKKLLEQNGLTSEEVGKYLGLLHQRYDQDGTDDALRGELLNAMARLCAQSVYKNEAKKLFKPLFKKALNDETNLVREAAVDGLIYIDPKEALKTLREGFVRDSSVAVRTKLIELAGTVGDKEDLDWLAEKMGAATESEPAWQAMLKIFKRSDAEVLNEWVTKFDSQNLKTRLSDDRRMVFLETAEQKAVSENKSEMLKAVRNRLAQLYSQSGKFDQAAKYWGLLREGAETTEEKEAISGKLIDVYLKWPNVEAAAQLVENSLLEKDLDPNNVVIVLIESHLAETASEADPNEILEALTGIELAVARPKWARQLRHWWERFGRPAIVADPNQTGG
jgi:HEAT repeat protein